MTASQRRTRCVMYAAWESGLRWTTSARLFIAGVFEELPSRHTTGPRSLLAVGAAHASAIESPGARRATSATRDRRAALRKRLESAGWGARVRTWEWRNQNPLPYHLA